VPLFGLVAPMSAIVASPEVPTFASHHTVVGMVQQHTELGARLHGVVHSDGDCQTCLLSEGQVEALKFVHERKVFDFGPPSLSCRDLVASLGSYEADSLMACPHVSDLCSSPWRKSASWMLQPASSEISGADRRPTGEGRGI